MNSAPHPHPSIDVDFLDTLRSASDVMLLHFLHKKSSDGELGMLETLADLFKRKPPQPDDCFGSNAAATMKVGGKSNDPFSYSDVIRNTFGTAIEKGVDDRHQNVLQRLLDGQPDGGKGLATALLFDSCKTLRDRSSIDFLVAAGADLNARRETRLPGQFDSNLLMREAFAFGNAALLTTFVELPSTKSRENMVNLVASPYTSFELNQLSALPINEQLAQGGFYNLQRTLRDHPEDVDTMLQAFDKAYGVDETAAVRARMVSTHLFLTQQDIDRKRNPPRWNDDQLEILLGDPSSSGYKAFERFVSQAPFDVSDANAENADKSLAGQLFHLALATHCPQVLAMFNERLDATKNLNHKHKKDPLSIAIQESKTSEGQFDAHRFKNTINVLVEHGHRLDRTDPFHPPAIHLLAKSKDAIDVKLAKLRVLLEMGCDPEQTHNGVSAMVSKDAGANWRDVVRAYKAKNAATAMLDELMSSASTPKRSL